MQKHAINIDPAKTDRIASRGPSGWSRASRFPMGSGRRGTGLQNIFRGGTGEFWKGRSVPLQGIFVFEKTRWPKSEGQKRPFLGPVLAATPPGNQGPSFLRKKKK